LLGAARVPGREGLVWRDSFSIDDVEWLMRHERLGQPFVSVGRVTGGYLVRSHGVADFFVSEEGSAVSVVPQEGVERTEVEEAFEQQVLPGIHQLAGCPALHASAVSCDQGIVCFTGPSFAGKSTIAALLSSDEAKTAKRWKLVSDDHLPLMVAGEDVLACPSSGWVRLREASAEGIREQGAWRGGKIAVDRQQEAEPRRLRRIYVLGDPADAVSISPISKRDGALVVAGQLFRIDHASPLLLTNELAFVEAVSVRVPARTLRYPREFDIVAAVERQILEDLAS
jgi:hypothetical protein